MSTTTITGTEIGPIIVNSSDDTYNIKKGATLILGGDAGGGGGSGPIGAITENYENPSINHDNVYNIDGRVIGYEVGIFTGGDRDKINIGATGEVIGAYGIAFAGNKVHITNNGEILAGGGMGAGAGIYAINATGAEIRNNGEVSGQIGISHNGGNGLIVNGADGFISGSQAGIEVSFGAMVAAGTAGGERPPMPHKAAGPSVEVINHGMVAVNGDGTAAFTADGSVNVVLTNDGTLQGDIYLGDGNSVFDNRGGTVIGSIIGGLGDDVLIVDAAKYKLLEAASGGDDTVKSTVSYTLSANVENLTLIGSDDTDGNGNGGDNILHGNGGNNSLDGKGGADDLFGGKGNDKLYGRAGTDEFHFATGGDHDKIMDFNAMDSDKIDFSGWDAVDSFTKVKAHAVNQGADVLITAGDDSVLIVGMHKADLVAGFFDFAS